MENQTTNNLIGTSAKESWGVNKIITKVIEFPSKGTFIAVSEKVM